MANEIKKGDSSPKTIRFYDERVKRLEDLGIELPAGTQEVIDELITRAEDLEKIREIMKKDYSEIDFSRG